jgi:hypothetical protein
MDKNYLIKSGILGGIAFLLLTWVVYGLILTDSYTETTLGRGLWGSEDFAWWIVVVIHLIWGFFVAKTMAWTYMNPLTPSSGMRRGAVMGIFVGLAANLGLSGLAPAVFIDVVVLAIGMAICGAISGYFFEQLLDKQKAAGWPEEH